MKRVLIITYYWPPNGGAPVQRWLKFAKYLPAHGWQPVIYTPANPELVMEDPGLSDEVPPVAEVIRRPIREPYALYRALTGRSGQKVHAGFLNEGGKKTWRDELAVWVRGNAFVPDARVWWVKPSIRSLIKYLREHPVDAIVSTGPPHSMHLIALGLKKRLPALRWIADWRDPWTNIDFYDQLKLTSWADRKHRHLEREVIASADVNVAVGWTMAGELNALGSRNTGTITNGYDPADVPSPAVATDEEFSLVHVGSMTATRDVPQLWKLLAELCRTDRDFDRRLKLRFIGAVDGVVLASIASAGLAHRVERMGGVDHDQAMREQMRARVLLLSVNDTANARGVLTSKVFEYLAVGRPILAVGPINGDVGRVLAPPHLLLDRTNANWDAAAVRALFDLPATGAASKEYSRVVLAERMAKVLGG